MPIGLGPRLTARYYRDERTRAKWRSARWAIDGPASSRARPATARIAAAAAALVPPRPSCWLPENATGVPLVLGRLSPPQTGRTAGRVRAALTAQRPRCLGPATGRRGRKRKKAPLGLTIAFFFFLAFRMAHTGRYR